MIRIDQRPAVLGTGAAGQSRQASGAAFKLPAREAASTSRGGSVGIAGPLDMLLMVQAEGDVLDRKKRQTRRGHDLLEGLDTLKASLLSGRVQIADLERLKASLSQARETTEDPRLDDVLAHIELRAAVELAKLGR